MEETIKNENKNLSYIIVNSSLEENIISYDSNIIQEPSNYYKIIFNFLYRQNF